MTMSRRWLFAAAGALAVSLTAGMAAAQSRPRAGDHGHAAVIANLAHTELLPRGKKGSNGQSRRARSRMVTEQAASSKPITPPPFSASAKRASGTCRVPASPRNCVVSS